MAWDWGQMIQAGLIGAAVGALKYFVRRPRKQVLAHTGTLHYHPVVWWLGMTGSLLFLGALAYGYWADGYTSVTWKSALAVLVVGLLSVPTVIDYYRGRHWFNSENFDYGRCFGLRRVFTWDSVVAVEYSDTYGWFVLKTKDGGKARITVALQGLPSFAEHVLKYVAAEAISPEAYPVLVATVQGNPPNIWVPIKKL